MGNRSEPPSWEAVDSRRAVVQIAYTVDDVWEAARRWHALTGAGPFFVKEHIPIDWAEHDGRPATFDHSTALGQWGPVMLELVVHHQVDPPELAQRIRGSGPGINHVAVFVDDLDAERDRLVREGATEVLRAQTGTTTFAFFEPADPLGHLLECYEATGILRSLYRMIRDAAVDWDGSDPVRPLVPGP
jgi:catechol 2,3-dioxygenase-like lactoylglutathione lyase family enzyme